MCTAAIINSLCLYDPIFARGLLVFSSVITVAARQVGNLMCAGAYVAMLALAKQGNSSSHGKGLSSLSQDTCLLFEFSTEWLPPRQQQQQHLATHLALISSADFNMITIII